MKCCDGSLTGMRVLLLGATGTIGRATAAALAAHGHEVVCAARSAVRIDGAEVRVGNAADARSLARDIIRDVRFDVLISCMASRTGVPADAWAIDYRAHVDALDLCPAAGIGHFVLLSAICVQKPLLAFQQAKRAFEDRLMRSALTWSIVRPTAFFKSLSGQVERVRRGQPYLLFGDGRMTACKPIGDADLADFIAGCIADRTRHNRILPVGGPGEAITPREQGEMLFALTGQRTRFRHVPPAMLDAIIGALSLAGHIVPAVADKAELARIGRYYATESMLVLDPVTGRYDADATPSCGTMTLGDHYARMISGEIGDDRGDHAVFA